MQTVSPKLNDDIVANLIEFAGNKNAGATEAIEGYTYIRRASLHELKGLFTKQEAIALADMYNGVKLTPRLQTQSEVIRAEVEDSERYEQTCSRHGADIKNLLAKTDALTAAQVYFLQQELMRAWEKNVDDSKSVTDMIHFLSNK